MYNYLFLFFSFWSFSRIQALGHKSSTRFVTDAPRLARATADETTPQPRSTLLRENRMTSICVSYDDTHHGVWVVYAVGVSLDRGLYSTKAGLRCCPLGLQTYATRVTHMETKRTGVCYGSF